MLKIFIILLDGVSSISQEQGFIKLESYYAAPTNSSVYLKDVADVFSNNKNIQKFLENVKIFDAKDEDWDYVTAVDIVKKIQSQKDNIDVTMLGEPEVLIEIKEEKEKNMIIEVLKVLFVVGVLFFGAAITIIYFHEDVNMAKTMEKLYHLITGKHKENPLLLAIPYSVGLGIGIITFFSRIPTSNKRRRKEPGPLEVEMFLYDKEMTDYLIHDEKSRKD